MKQRATRLPKSGAVRKNSQLGSDESFLLQAFERISNPAARYAATMIVDSFTTEITPENRAAGLAIWTRLLQRGRGTPPAVAGKYEPTSSRQAGS